MKTAIAIAAHPDDIEFMMSGTLVLLKRAGYETHYMNLSSGNLGTVEYGNEAIRKIRLKEARKASQILGAHFHSPFCDDLEIFYEKKTLKRIAGIIREVKPGIILTHPPIDYMEDHTNTCRLVVTAAFARGMINFDTIPKIKADNYECAIYHALPHTLRTNLCQQIIPGAFVNTGSVQQQKGNAMKAHQSQQNWLDTSQNLNSYLQTMEDISLAIGKMSKRFTYAEGWSRHLHYGFCKVETDPLKVLGNDYLANEDYEADLNRLS